VIALRQRQPHWRILHCPEPALLHDGYRPETLAGRDKARRLREAMEAELREHPGDPYCCAKLGGLELREGKPDRAIRLLRQGLSHCPADAHAERFELLLPLAMAHAAADPGLAIGIYRQALGLPLDPRLTLAARLQLAELLHRQGDQEPALSLCREVTRIDPGFPRGWFQLGRLERQRGDLPAAIQAYRRVIELEPTHAEAHQNLALALLLGGDLPGARQGLQTAITLLRQQGRVAEAEDLRQRVKGLVTLEN
jgi:tetratricopeptide (TPR) repeat protein